MLPLAEKLGLLLEDWLVLRVAVTLMLLLEV
jgi:hypothetical protein